MPGVFNYASTNLEVYQLQARLHYATTPSGRSLFLCFVQSRMHNSAIVAVWSQDLTALLARMTAQTRRKERDIRKTLQFFNVILTRQSKRTKVSSSIPPFSGCDFTPKLHYNDVRIVVKGNFLLASCCFVPLSEKNSWRVQLESSHFFEKRAEKYSKTSDILEFC